MTGYLLRITEQCNQRCIFCHSDYGKSAEISIDEFRKNIRAIRGNPVLISGGEPTLNKDLMRMIDVLKENGIRFSIITNGSDPDKISEVIEKSPESIFISFYSLDEKTDNRITDSKYFQNRIKTSEILSKSDINTIANVLIIKQNIHELKEICTFLREKKIKIKLAYPMFINNAEKNFEDIFVPLEKLKEVLNNVDYDFVEGIPPCITKKKFLGLDNVGFDYKLNLFDKNSISKCANKNKRTEFCTGCNENCDGILEQNYDVLKKRSLFKRWQE